MRTFMTRMRSSWRRTGQNRVKRMTLVSGCRERIVRDNRVIALERRKNRADGVRVSQMGLGLDERLTVNKVGAERSRKWKRGMEMGMISWLSSSG
jgi:hypothetical protein